MNELGLLIADVLHRMRAIEQHGFCQTAQKVRDLVSLCDSLAEALDGEMELDWHGHGASRGHKTGDCLACQALVAYRQAGGQE